MGAAMLIATYDYWGYYNVCFLGGEVKDPGRTIPRALIISIVAVAAIYVVMNISVLGVVPWREMVGHHGEQNNYVISVFMERIYGNWAGRAIAVLIIWTAFASVFLAACWDIRACHTPPPSMAITFAPSPASIPRSASRRFRCWRLVRWPSRSVCCAWQT